MSMLDHLQDWRQQDWDEWRRDDTPVTEEIILRQFVYVLITDFIQERTGEIVEWALRSDSDEIPGLSDWVDEYAERSPREGGGFLRHLDTADTPG